MQIADKKRYGDKISMQLSKLEDMHDKFREQKDFCFRAMFEEFEIMSGKTFDFKNSFEVKLNDNKKYTIVSVTFGYDEYAYVDCIAEDGSNISIEPYYLDAYDDFENVFSAVYDHLHSEYHGILPTDEFALSTFKYLEQECNWANENKVNLETFGRRMNAHTIDLSCELFDFNIGAFVFTISKVNEKFIVNNSYEIYNGNGILISTDTILSLKKRNGIQN